MCGILSLWKLVAAICAANYVLQTTYFVSQDDETVLFLTASDLTAIGNLERRVAKCLIAHSVF